MHKQMPLRLAQAIKQIDGGNIIDVGSDHAYISCYLLSNHLIDYAYNIDINKLPLKQTIANTHKYNVDDRCKNILGDGLQTKAIDKIIDYCVIAGMGGKNIIDIIEHKNNKIKIKNFILIPNNNANLVRAFLSKHQYRIVYEEIIQENEYFYEMMVANKQKGLFFENVQSVYFGPYNLLYPSKSFKAMLRSRKTFLKKQQLHLKNERYAHE
jgi:tRNA (adenine22-N1)-methyltransferase